MTELTCFKAYDVRSEIGVIIVEKIDIDVYQHRVLADYDKELYDYLSKKRFGPVGEQILQNFCDWK